MDNIGGNWADCSELGLSHVSRRLLLCCSIERVSLSLVVTAGSLSLALVSPESTSLLLLLLLLLPASSCFGPLVEDEADDDDADDSVSGMNDACTCAPGCVTDAGFWNGPKEWPTEGITNSGWGPMRNMRHVRGGKK